MSLKNNGSNYVVGFRDGVDYIEIGQAAATALGRRLGWYDTSMKYTVEGEVFHMYAGLYFYLITKGNNRRFLTATAISELKGAKEYVWQNVPGLETHLESNLLHNLRNNPLIMEYIKANDLPIMWHEPHRELRNNELRWLRVVRKSISRLRYDHIPT